MNKKTETGQWEIDGTCIVSKGEGVVAKIFREDAIPLIKAAPDLLATCDGLLSVIEAMEDGYDDENARQFLIQQARVAVAKAKGGAE